MVSSTNTVHTCLDKLAFFDFCRDAGLPAIATSDTLESSLIGTDRYVVKERFGAGSKAVGIDLSRDQAAEWARRLDHPIFQPCVSGAELSIDTYRTLNGDFKGAVARTRDVVVDGESRVTTTLDDPEAAATAQKLVEQLDLRGHAVIQAFRNDDGLHLIECNPRVGGASTLAFASGLDSLWWFLLEASGADVADYPFLPVPPPLQLVRVPHDVIT